MSRIVGGRWILATLLWIAAPGWAPPAAAMEGCDAWFPDFACGRSGRAEGFFKPIVHAYLFEDPFVTTGAYPYYVYHDFPGRSALQGGEAHVAALQLRVALTDRIALIATKDGYVWKRPGNPLLDDTEGWLNLGFGLKGVLYEAEEIPFIVSGILRYEADTGSTDTYQGFGDGLVVPSIAAAWGIGALRLVGDVGAQIPIASEQSTSLFAHVYAGLELTPRIQPFAQLSWIGWVDSGDGSLPVPLNLGFSLPLDTVQTVLGTGPFEGADVFDLGSRGVSGLDLFTLAIGSHFALTDRITFSVAYERPVSHHKGIFQQRVTSSLSYEF